MASLKFSLMYVKSVNNFFLLYVPTYIITHFVHYIHNMKCGLHLQLEITDCLTPGPNSWLKSRAWTLLINSNLINVIICVNHKC